jgi:hypothetical protein
MKPSVDFIDKSPEKKILQEKAVEATKQKEEESKSPEILGNALALASFFPFKMECAGKYWGRVRALPGLCTWGYRSRTRAARSFKQ